MLSTNQYLMVKNRERGEQTFLEMSLTVKADFKLKRGIECTGVIENINREHRDTHAQCREDFFASDEMLVLNVLVPSGLSNVFKRVLPH